MIYDTILILKNCSVLEEESVAKTTMPSHKSQLYAIYGDHSRGAELSIARGDSFGREAPGHLLQMSDTHFRAISCYAMARKTNDSKYKKEARKHRAAIKFWITKGNPNVSHYSYLLDAENAALKGQTIKAMEFYGRATIMASRAGFLQDAALANERYGEFMLHDMSRTEAAVYRFEKAILLYSEWGAHGKAAMLREKYADLWPAPEDIAVSFDRHCTSLRCSAGFGFSSSVSLDGMSAFDSIGFGVDK